MCTNSTIQPTIYGTDSGQFNLRNVYCMFYAFNKPAPVSHCPSCCEPWIELRSDKKDYNSELNQSNRFSAKGTLQSQPNVKQMK